MPQYQLIPENLYEVQSEKQRLLFHVPTTSLFEIDPLAGHVLDQLSALAMVDEQTLKSRFELEDEANEALTILQDFQQLNIVRGPEDPPEPGPSGIALLNASNIPELNTMVLNVNTGCNLGCSYCYKEDLTAPMSGAKMDLETAIQSVELLLRESKNQKKVNVVFFGGEPLLAMDTIQGVVEYTERRCEEIGKVVDFSLTTNATLLTEKTIDFLDAHRFGITISIDGPSEVHDLHRKTIGGRGTYRQVARKVKMLLSRPRPRTVGARVSIASGNVDILAIHHHLTTELGFSEVGYSPVTATKDSPWGLNTTDLAKVFGGMKALGVEYLEAALQGRNSGFTNMQKLMDNLVNGTKKLLPCGAGSAMLATEHDGKLSLCHRFTGSDVPGFGSVSKGIDRNRQKKFLQQAVDQRTKPCDTCYIRYLCAGGCHHESHVYFEDPTQPTLHYCDLMRDWIHFGIEVYAQIQRENPDFFRIK